MKNLLTGNGIHKQITEIQNFMQLPQEISADHIYGPV